MKVTGVSAQTLLARLGCVEESCELALGDAPRRDLARRFVLPLLILVCARGSRLQLAESLVDLEDVIRRKLVERFVSVTPLLAVTLVSVRRFITRLTCVIGPRVVIGGIMLVIVILHIIQGMKIPRHNV